jgi:uncharacterized protein YjbI with pentapeptide repeats
MRLTFLEGAILNGADLRQANIAEANLKSAIYDEQTQWNSDFDLVSAGVVQKKKKKWFGLF